MNRRRFTQIALAALAGIPLLRSAFAQPTPNLGTTWGGLATSDEFGKAGLHYRIPPIHFTHISPEGKTVIRHFDHRGNDIGLCDCDPEDVAKIPVAATFINEARQPAGEQ